MSEAEKVGEMEQRVIAMILEARLRIERASEMALEVREQGDLGPTRRQQALEEVVAPSRTRVTELLRDARDGIRGGWGVGVGGIGTPTRPWDQGLSPSGIAAQNDMLGYIDSAARVFAVDLQLLESGEASSAEAAAEREAAAVEVAAYEESHAAPEGVVAAADRVSMSR